MGSQCRSQGHSGPGWATWGARCVQGHEQGVPGRETSPAGPSEGPAGGTRAGSGRSFLPRALESRARSGLENVLSAALSGAEQFRFSGESWAARVAIGRTRRRQTLSQVPARHCPGGGGDADKQNGLLGLPACHRLLTTADVSLFFCFCFFWWKEKRKGLCPCLWVGCTQSRCSINLLRGFCRRTHVLQDGFILSWSHPL